MTRITDDLPYPRCYNIDFLRWRAAGRNTSFNYRVVAAGARPRWIDVEGVDLGYSFLMTTEEDLIAAGYRPVAAPLNSSLEWRRNCND